MKTGKRRVLWLSGSLGVSLPSQWTRDLGIKRGDKVISIWHEGSPSIQFVVVKQEPEEDAPQIR
jgi:hypothetical protein